MDDLGAPPRLRDPLLGLLERRPKLRRVVPRGDVLDVREEVDRIIYAEISARRKDGGAAERDDVLSLLIAARDPGGEPMSEVELRDQLVTLLEAGHETTATALSWAFERLTRNPEAYARLSAEVRGGERGYLEATVKETLRSRTVVIDTIRKLDRPLEIGGYRLQAGWYAGPATALIHQSADFFEDPEAFRPDRFLVDDPPFEAWFPFGGGRRRCVGSNLAQMEMAIVIEQVLSRYEVRADGAPDGEAARIQHVTLTPADGARVVLEGAC